MADPEQTGTSGPPTEPLDTASNVHDLGRDTGAQRLHRLQVEAHKLAHEQIEILTQDLNAIARRATEVSNDAASYPVGVRELCSRLADELTLQGQTLTAIMARTAP
ncbi:MAG TPA: hypothetical protein VKU90_10345 [Caulobacteraceae bacterium]|jgi:hypothetical protein|nr:hypothetical protein [Caulobacteraceae bacterium]